MLVKLSLGSYAGKADVLYIFIPYNPIALVLIIKLLFVKVSIQLPKAITAFVPSKPFSNKVC